MTEKSSDQNGDFAFLHLVAKPKFLCSLLEIIIIIIHRPNSYAAFLVESSYILSSQLWKWKVEARLLTYSFVAKQVHENGFLLEVSLKFTSVSSCSFPAFARRVADAERICQQSQ